MDWVTSEPGEFSPCLSLLPSFILRLMLFPDTSEHDAPTLPSNGITPLWCPHTQCIENIFHLAFSSVHLQCLLSAFSAFLCLMLFFALCPPLFCPPSCPVCLPCLCLRLCCDLSHVAFQERRVRMRVPISSVALPRAAAAPPLAELRCDWPRDDSLAHLPVKRLSQFYADRKRRPHCAPKRQKTKSCCILDRN